MGSENDLKKENKKLKNQIEKELQPQIEKSKKKHTTKKKQKYVINNNQIDLSPKEIQNIMEENVKKTEKITCLQNQTSYTTTELELHKNHCANSLAENNQLKSSCGQLQIMNQAQKYNLNLNNTI